MDEDQLYVNAPPYRPRPVTEMIPGRLASIIILETLPTRGSAGPTGTVPRSARERETPLPKMLQQPGKTVAGLR
jgi:hypothetical protein